jgi:uncharacterized protein (DUF2141 family)
MTTVRRVSCWTYWVTIAAMAAVSLQAQRPAPATPGTAALAVTVMTDEADPRPLRRALVSLQAGILGVPRTAVTDDEGRAAFTELPAGNYTLSATKPGYVRAFYGSRTPGMGPGVAVALVAGQRVEVRIPVLRGGVISGVVRSPTGRPAASISVQAVSERLMRSRSVSFFGDGGMTSATTDDRGAYRIYGLPPGEYVVSAQPGAASLEMRPVTADEVQWAARQTGAAAATEAPSAPPSPGPTTAPAPVYHPGTPDVGAATVITLRPGEERLGVDIALQYARTSQVRGRLLDAEGRPQANQTVSLRPISNGRSTALDVLAMAGPSARTGPDGAFSLTAVRPGRYTLGARAMLRPAPGPPPPGADAAAMQAAAASAMAAAMSGSHWASEDITVGGDDLADLTLVLRPGMTVSGRVVYDGTTLEAPKNLSALSFQLAPDQTGTGIAAIAAAFAASAQVRVAADGTFSASGVAPGRYRFQTTASVLSMIGADDAVGRDTWVLKSAMVGGLDIADAPLEVAPGQDVSGLVVTFTDRPTELSGIVYDPAGRVTADFPIVVFATARNYWTTNSRRVRVARPATDGSYRITGLPAGEYFVAAVTAVESDQLSSREFLEQLAAASFKITLADAEKRRQDLKLGGGS